MDAYNANEMMALAAVRLVREGDIVFAGTGIPMLAATAAKHLFGSKIVVFFETGGIDPALHEIPMAVADLRVMHGTSLNAGLVEAFSIVGHRRLHTVAFLGAAQIDQYGNLNTTSIGDYHHPKTRFPGSGGAGDASALASSVITFMRHEKRRFVEKLDYLTSVGWYKGGKTRRELGLTRGGPLAVVTDLGVMGFHETTREMYLTEYYRGVSPDVIVKNTGFPLDVSQATESQAPTAEELSILREKVDPQSLILGELDPCIKDIP